MRFVADKQNTEFSETWFLYLEDPTPPSPPQVSHHHLHATLIAVDQH